MIKQKSNKIIKRLFKKMTMTSDEWIQLQSDFFNKKSKNYICALYKLKSVEYRALKIHYL